MWGGVPGTAVKGLQTSVGAICRPSLWVPAKPSTRPLAGICFFPACLPTGPGSQHPNPKRLVETSTGPASVRFLPLDPSALAEERETNLPRPSLQRSWVGVGREGECVHMSENTGEEADKHSPLCDYAQAPGSVTPPDPRVRSTSWEGLWHPFPAPPPHPPPPRAFVALLLLWPRLWVRLGKALVLQNPLHHRPSPCKMPFKHRLCR